MGSTSDKILMCPPDYFTVDYVINPWMAGHESSLDIDLAKRQWQLLRDAIEKYAEIVEMEPQPGLPDLRYRLRQQGDRKSFHAA
jgi:N-dimethylarginine dimethylaminohydrolase